MKTSPNRRICDVLVLAAAVLILPSGALANQAPHAVASAGVDPNTGQVLNQVTLYIGPADSGVFHTVTGGGSSDPDGDALTYSWECRDASGNKCILGFNVPKNQVDFRPMFPEGTWDITLTVNDGNFHTATDTVRVKVLVDLTPPTVTPPPDTTVSSTETGGARGADSGDLHHFLFNRATATDNSTAIFTHLPPQANGADVDDNTLFALGPAVVTFRIADRFGNVGMATAQVYVADIQTNDIFVGAGRVVGPFGDTAGEVRLIRGGNHSLFCKGGPNNLVDPNFFYQNVEVLVDSLGRAVFLADMPSMNSNAPHHGLFRCDFPGDTPRLLGLYQGAGTRPAGDPVQFPGDTFGQVGGLHLARTRAIVIQNNIAQIVNEDSYVFAAKRINSSSLAHISLKSVRYRSLGGFSEDGPEPEQSHNSGSGFIPDMTNYKGDTYSAGRGNRLRRESFPLTIQASGTVFNTQFNVSLSLFGAIREINGSQGIATMLDPVNQPNAASACQSPPPPGVSTATPASAGSYYQFGTDGEIVVTPDSDFGLLMTYNGLGMCGASLSATCPWSSYLANVDQYLIDDDPMNDLDNRFLHDACTVMRAVPVRPVMPVIHPTNPQGNDPSKLVWGPQGLLGTQFRSGRVFLVPDSPSGVQDLVSTPIAAAWGIAAFPPQNVSPSGLVIVIQINSPVDVLVTDPNGRRLGVDAGGTAVNDFDEKGLDTGAASHPRFYVIRGAQPGDFSVQSIGTGTGPFEIHIFGINLDRTLGEHLVSSGTAAPGLMGKHDFKMDAAGSIAFNNAAPIAMAGSDQMLSADASGNAVAMLDGSASSDPDGDALSFTWGGPGVFASGAVAQLTLPVGVHLLTLTVDDGKGGTGKDTVTVTVTGAADTTPPVLALPANMTVEATGASGAVVTYTATGTDAEDGALTPVCSPASGATFPLGATTVDCTVTDSAGAQAAGSFSVTVQDTTPPVITGSRSPMPNAAGWNNTDVIVTFACTDAVGVGSAPASPQTISSEGAGQSASGTCFDAAGNSAAATVSGIDIDKTPPILAVTANPQPNGNGWNNSDVTVSFAAVDTLSSVGVVSGPVTLTTEGAGQVVTGSATDLAGNLTSGSVTINLDKTSPEAFNQFDPASQEVAVFGRDSLSGVPPGALTPIAVAPAKQDDEDHDKGTSDGDNDKDDDNEGAELRTYKVFDLAGNFLLLVEKVKKEGHEVKAKIVSLQYNDGQVLTSPRNRQNFEWALDKSGQLKELEQKLVLGIGEKRQKLEAKFDAQKNQTTIKRDEPEPETKVIKPGLVLLRMATERGSLVLEF